MFEQDNKPRFSIVHGGKSLINFTEAELLAVDGITQVTIDNLKAVAALEVVNEKANKHIIAVYPEHKQLNTMRSGTQAENDTMSVFIDAVRDWANSENPQDADLAAIAV